MLKRILSLVIVLCALQTKAAVYYVSPTGTNTNGLSWATAYNNVYTALSVAIAGDDIWVAAGVYKPSNTNNRNHTFFLKNGVDVYGGFLGTETALSQRNIAGAPTTLSGDIGQPGSLSDNSYHVLYGDGLTTNVTVDGFRIIDGNSDSRGGGVYIKDSPSGLLILKNCTVYNNWAYAYGGGICIDGGASRIENCQILNNNCDRYGGGGIAVLSGTSGGTRGDIAVLNCLISGNVGTEDGAAICHIGNGDFYMDQCIVTNNTGFQSIIYADGSWYNIQLFNSLITGNTTTYSFGSTIAVDVWGGAGYATFTNLTVAHNKNQGTSTSYGGMYLGDAAYHRVRNCIVYGNTPTSAGKQIFGGGSFFNCIVEGGIVGGTNVSGANPQFTNPGSLAFAPFDGTQYDYTCSLLSPAVDAGNNSYLDTTYFYRDLADANRVHGGTVDIGAYEDPYCLINASITVPTDTVLCTGESVVLTAAGAANGYLWSTGSTQNAITISTAGTYRVTVTNSGTGCKGTASRTITATSVAVDITGDLTNCIGDTTRLSATGSNLSYAWSNGDSTSFIDISTAGTYSVTATTLAGGCTATDQVTVTFSAKPNTSITFSENSGVAPNDGNVCAGNAVTITATGGTSYLWNIGGTTASISPIPTSSTSYFAQVSNGSGCSVYTDTIGITIVPNPPVSITGNTKVCAGQSAALTAFGGSSQYTWSNGATVSSITVNTTGTYTVTVDNGGGCTASDSHSITVSSPTPQISITEQSGMQPHDGVVCEGYVVTLSGAGGVSYNWSHGASSNSTQVTPPVGTTTYTLSATDATGCVGTDNITLTAHAKPVISFTFPDSIASNAAAFTLSGMATPPGGTFSGNDGVSGNSFFPTSLFNGSYGITYSYTDQYGCVATPVRETFVIYQITSVSTPATTLVKIFPNPASELLNIVSDEHGVQQYRFTDMLGKKIYSGTFTATMQLDVSKLATGTYVLQIEGNSWMIAKP